ncbi:hypothetical protein RJT34_23505 [Clitoria ternatea]|uniref:Uncharacterized protein n=1 Tax=Clitoria ternatea TaxID=43366 RepID=A0AAN9FSE9_CLITE
MAKSQCCVKLKSNRLFGLKPRAPFRRVEGGFLRHCISVRHFRCLARDPCSVPWRLTPLGCWVAGGGGMLVVGSGPLGWGWVRLGVWIRFG